MNDKKLGMGLDALIGTGSNSSDVTYIDLEMIRPNPYQPRQDFDQKDINILTESIKKNSVLQPIVVRRQNAGYELVAGERRVRAAKHAGLSRIPAVIKSVDDDALLRLALVENIHRKDLNPLEKAEAFRALANQMGISHEEIGNELSLDRSTVTNFLRLLSLPDDLKEAIRKGDISLGHAKALLSLDEASEQRKLYKQIKTERLSVRSTEKQVSKEKDMFTKDLESQLQESLGTKVEITGKKGKGKIVIEFYSKDQLNGLCQKLLNC